MLSWSDWTLIVALVLMAIVMLSAAICRDFLLSEWRKLTPRQRVSLGVYLIALCGVGGGVGYYGAKYYRLKTSTCKPCEAAAAATPETVATEPGMGVSNP